MSTPADLSKQIKDLQAQVEAMQQASFGGQARQERPRGQRPYPDRSWDTSRRRGYGGRHQGAHQEEAAATTTSAATTAKPRPPSSGGHRGGHPDQRRPSPADQGSYSRPRPLSNDPQRNLDDGFSRRPNSNQLSMIYVQENSSLITSKMLPSSKWKLTENK
jgi:hypothetical protein